MTASPPPKRPETFPPPPKTVEEHPLSGKGKRKARESGIGVSAEQNLAVAGVHETGPGAPQSSEHMERSSAGGGEDDIFPPSGTAPKRFKEEKIREGKKGSRAPAAASGIKLRSLSGGSTQYSSGSWSEHRDAVSSWISHV